MRERLGPWDHWPRSPNTYLVDERPRVWVEHEGNWYPATLIGWTWSEKAGHWWGTVDFYIGPGGVHHRNSVHQDRIRRYEDRPDVIQTEERPTGD